MSEAGFACPTCQKPWRRPTAEVGGFKVGDQIDLGDGDIVLVTRLSRKKVEITWERDGRPYSTLKFPEQLKNCKPRPPVPGGPQKRSDREWHYSLIQAAIERKPKGLSEVALHRLQVYLAMKSIKKSAISCGVSPAAIRNTICRAERLAAAVR